MPLWALSKPLVFLLLTWLILRRLRAGAPAMLPTVPSEGLWRPKGAWRWTAPIPALVVFAYLALLSPLAGPLPQAENYPDPVVLVIAASITFFTTNVVEELSHGQSDSTLTGLPLTLGAIMIQQGVFGLFVGYLWSQYRNVWALIAAHSIINTLPLFFLR
ncbi:MAG: hypothetical protein ACRDTG_11145 [Pseudonocardiaceae bacterium]